jgi:two-component system, cell cycle sensor histidine kinase and response regulator CckA
MGDVSVRVAFETARLRLSHILAEGQEARLTAYRSACEHSARTLAVDRVGIWFLNERGDALTRVLQYTLSTNSFDQGGEIQRRGAERYFEALLSRRVVAAADTLRDPRTSQLESYLLRERVAALLDAPIYRDGRVIGVVCHEHVGGVREWTEREAGFASAVADLLTILIDQAERAELRAALDAQREAAAQNQKMQALVRLARVVVHDLANVMMVASLRAGDIETEDDPREASREVVDVLAYGNKLLGQLRTFCNPRGSAGPSEVDAVLLLRGMEGTLRSLLGKSVAFSLHCSLPSLMLAISPVELEQLVLNLCMNAKDATHELPGASVSISLALDGDVATLTVADNGCGMEESAQLGIFEPFYTTKPGHSGVGLSAVYGIVERAHGRIALTSAPRQGTTFRVTLPVGEQAPPSQPPWAF